MNPKRIPPLRQAEITSPVHALDEDTSGTIDMDPFNPFVSNVPQTTGKIDTSNLSPHAGSIPTKSPNPENLEPIRSPLPVRLPETNSGKGATGIENERFSNTKAQIHSEVDWILVVPTKEGFRRHTLTVGERLQPTLDTAIIEKEKSSANAKWTGYALNAAIGMLVLLGSLTTGLSALAALGGRSTAIATTAFGALATLVASYLACARGSNEPELSITRTKDLEQFIRECRSFQLDYGHSSGQEFDLELIRFRRRFKELLGNANGERKLALPT